MRRSSSTTITTTLRIIGLPLLLAASGYLLADVMGLSQLDAAASFALGIAFGGIISSAIASGSHTTGNSSHRLHAISTTHDAPREHDEGSLDKKSVFVGNLAFKASREDLQALFANYGEVHHVRIMVDRTTHRPRGFGFVEMDASGAAAAIAALDGTEFYGRTLRVNEGNDRRPRRPF